jgi:hypothetical protein
MCPAPVEADQVEDILANVDSDYRDLGFGFG